jgi:molecular chaperone GrpE
MFGNRHKIMSKDDKKAEKKIEELENEVTSLQQEIEQLKGEKQELFEQLQRVSADYVNFQKRSARQVADSVAYEKRSIIKSLLPSIDNFEHALMHACATQGEDDNLVKGIQLVFTHMMDALKAHGVERIDAAGQIFDPNQHEAMMQKNDPAAEDNAVLEVYQSGYRMGEQVIRPAKVIVNKIASPPAPAAPQAAAEPSECAGTDPAETTDVEPEV